MKIVYWTPEEDQILKDNYVYGISKCCELLPHRGKEGLKTRCLKLKLRHTKEERIRVLRDTKVRMYSPNIKMFMDSTPETAYLLGIWWADGCIRNGNYTISHVMQLKDFKYLKETYTKTGNWKFYHYVNKQNNRRYVNVIGSHADFYDFLFAHDYYIKSGTSAHKILNHIPKHLHEYWWRGYFDGDGYVSKKINCTCFISTYDQDWSFVIKSFPNLDFRIEKLMLKDECKKIKGFRHSSSAKISRKETVTTLMQYIYKNRETDHIGLSRKYQIAKRFLLEK